MQNDLLAEVDEFLKEADMAPSTFGKRAIGASETYGRIERGAVSMATAQKLREFMAAWRAGERPRHIPTPRTKAPAEASQ